MQRKLASVQRVSALVPIEGADFIELAQIEGWRAVVKKGEFAVGDLAVFFEIDAIPPDLPEFRFLWTPRNTPEGEIVARPPKFRIRTMKLRGQLSQGLLLPFSTAAEVARQLGAEPLSVADCLEGDDLTALLGVQKYEPPLPGGGFRANFPGVLSKTDEMRIQSEPEVLAELTGLPYVITLKYDGTSSTFLSNPLDSGAFHVCGRNFSIQEGDNLYWRVAKRYGLAEKLTDPAFSHYAIQGEIVGPGIQKNPLGLKEVSLFVFSVFDVPEGKYLSHDAAQQVIADLGLTPVAVVEEGDGFAHTQPSLLKLAEGRYEGTNNEREGIVIRPREERHSPTLGGRLSFKAISNTYLLKEE